MGDKTTNHEMVETPEEETPILAAESTPQPPPPPGDGGGGGGWGGGWGFSAFSYLTDLQKAATVAAEEISRNLLRKQNPQLDNHYTYDNGPNNPPTTFNFGQKHLATYVYQLSPVEDLALATTLVRPLYLYTDEDMSKELILSQNNYGSVNRVFIISNEDKVVTREIQEWMIEMNPTDEVKEIEGSDHMVMMSKPVELFIHLLHIAEKY
ncbi:methyl jasmonate esterase 1-like [Nicotiana sylvestris]|uniref:Probable esterase PIR7A n=1 Tax=Nicotiana sylvestris TaxID=4096 RepID=A0A1U7WDM7_NICSY|nr:PREDICTED: probable esterase PIR7A [Nicotiana sylvestris]